MTNEQKLQRLLQIAVKNGWKTDINHELQSFIVGEDCNFKIYPETCRVDNDQQHLVDTIWFSLNDLVDNWQHGKISFLEALCKADHVTVNFALKGEDVILNAEGLWKYPNHIQVRFLWGLQETPNKLGWLFRIFAHLFEE